jgi:glycosyltransferase involved in cell wall biosynthesis
MDGIIKVECKLVKENNTPLKIARISTIPFFVATQLKQQILDINNAGAEVTIISTYGFELKHLVKEKHINHINIYIPREIKLLSDLSALIKLYNAFRKHSFDIVHSTTPKAGLLTAIAGLMANIPIRLHTFTGQVWCNSKGIKRWILKWCDWIIIQANTRCYADGFSQVTFLKEQRVIESEDDVKVLGAGSLAGIDLTRFDRALWQPRKKELLSRFGVDNANKKIVFVGRLAYEKGIVELIQAFSILLERSQKYDLLLIGSFEANAGNIPQDILDTINNSKRIFHFKYTSCPEKFLIISDILCLPSYREGFGTTVIEAAAMGIPTIGTNVVGLVDSIVNYKTGLLVPIYDSISLANAIEDTLINTEKRHVMGEQAYQRVKKEYDSTIVSKHVMDEYIKLVNDKITGSK